MGNLLIGIAVGATITTGFFRLRHWIKGDKEVEYKHNADGDVYMDLKISNIQTQKQKKYKFLSACFKRVGKENLMEDLKNRPPDKKISIRHNKKGKISITEFEIDINVRLLGRLTLFMRYTKVL